jgi:hypothetical protein
MIRLEGCSALCAIPHTPTAGRPFKPSTITCMCCNTYIICGACGSLLLQRAWALVVPSTYSTPVGSLKRTASDDSDQNGSGVVLPRVRPLDSRPALSIQAYSSLPCMSIRGMIQWCKSVVRPYPTRSVELSIATWLPLFGLINVR